MAGEFEERSFASADSQAEGLAKPSMPVTMQDPRTALLTGRGRYLDDGTLIRLFVEITTGSRQRAEELAPILAARYGSFAALLCVPERELAALSGIGAHLPPMLRVVQEAALRYNHSRMNGPDILADEQRLLDYLSARLARETVEQFRILFLGEGQKLLADEAQARGTVNHTPVYPREVARRALELSAVSVVLVHNHPSGDPTPSEADLTMTRQVQAGLEAIGIGVADHYIIGNGRHTSFRASGLL